MSGGDFLTGLRKGAQQVIAENALTLARLTGAAPRPSGTPARMTLAERARRGWDLPAKVAIARQIAAEEGAARPNPRPGEDEAGRALPNARWAQRTAEAAGPVFTDMAGLAQEIGDVGKITLNNMRRPQEVETNRPNGTPVAGRTFGESLTDLHNYQEGLQAAEEGRPIHRENLRTYSQEPIVGALFHPPPMGRTGLPPR